MQPRLKLFLAGLAAISSVVTACSGTTGGTPAATPAAAGAAAGGAGSYTLPAPEKTSIKIGLSAPTEAVQYAAELADTLGYYKAEGFQNVQVIAFEGDGKVVQALIAGALDMGVIGSSSAVNSVTTSSPIKIVAMNSDITTDDFLCTKDIKTAAQVKGQRVAISTFGSTAHGSVLISLKALGLTPQDVTIVQIGNESARIAAMKGGSVGCSVIDVSLEPQMLALGFNLLYSQQANHVIWGRSGLATTAAFISKYPNTVLDVAAAGVKAQNYIFANTADAGAKFSAFNQEPASQGTPVVQAFLKYGSRSMGWTPAAFTVPRDTLAQVNPQQANVDVTKAYDESFLQKLWAGGYYKQIGDPENPFPAG